MNDKPRKYQRWYVKYSPDAYALGPIDYGYPVTEEDARKAARLMFGEEPTELWPAQPWPITGEE